PGGTAEEMRGGGDARGAALVAPGIRWGDPGGRRAGGETSGEPADAARHEQPRGALRRRKNNGAGDTDRDSRQARPPPPDLVGKAAEEQQRGEIGEYRGRVDQRQGDA